jgi:hypothetical protein
MSAQPTIIIVDDDPGIRESLEGLLRSVGLQVKALASVPEFLKEGRPEGTRLPGPRCQVAWPKRSRFSAGSLHDEHSRSDHFHYRVGRHPDVGPGDEGGSGGVSDQAVP